MKLLVSQEEFNNKNTKDLVPCECEECKCVFYLQKHYIIKNKNRFCSRRCSNHFKNKNLRHEVKCSNCNKIFSKINSLIKRSKKHFCSVSCKKSFIKNNTKLLELECLYCKIKFNRPPYNLNKTGKHFCSISCASKYTVPRRSDRHFRSKLEIYLEDKLVNQYKDVGFEFNNRSIIGCELDIYIPSLKLAFEINGTHHYKPIYGLLRFNQTENMDKKKINLCEQKEIRLIIINTSKDGTFSEQDGDKYFNFISSILNEYII